MPSRPGRPTPQCREPSAGDPRAPATVAPFEATRGRRGVNLIRAIEHPEVARELMVVNDD